MKNKIMIAHQADLQSLKQLEENCFATDRLSLKQLRHFHGSPTAMIAIAKQEDSVIGEAIVLFRKNSYIARLYSFAIDPHFQGQGTARKLMGFIDKLIQKRHCKEIRLEVMPDNHRAIYFYKKNGYAPFGIYKKFYEDGKDALRMRKELV